MVPCMVSKIVSICNLIKLDKVTGGEGGRGGWGRAYGEDGSKTRGQCPPARSVMPGTRMGCPLSPQLSREKASRLFQNVKSASRKPGRNGSLLGMEGAKQRQAAFDRAWAGPPPRCDRTR